MQLLRQTLRKKRKSLSAFEQKIHAKYLLYQVQKSGVLRYAQHIALYSSFDGEIQTQYLFDFLSKQGKTVYLPIIDKQTLYFVKHSPHSVYQLNRFNIKEPKHTGRIYAKKLNVIFMPCVGFDLQGNRLGMGGGFYDKTLSFKIKQDKYRSPKLYALAHQCQQTQNLETQVWDIKPNAIITEQAINRFIF